MCTACEPPGYGYQWLKNSDVEDIMSLVVKVGKLSPHETLSFFLSLALSLSRSLSLSLYIYIYMKYKKYIKTMKYFHYIYNGSISWFLYGSYVVCSTGRKRNREHISLGPRTVSPLHPRTKKSLRHYFRKESANVFVLKGNMLFQKLQITVSSMMKYKLYFICINYYRVT
jgi:hypothetical protein